MILKVLIQIYIVVSPGCCKFLIIFSHFFHFNSNTSCYVFFYRENTITGIIDSTFSVENNSFGALVVHELKPSGATITVTEENKREYVKLYVNYRFMRGIEQQFLALQKGILSMLLIQFHSQFNNPD